MSKPIPGLILAGGAASRLGGGDKILRLIGGRTILTRLVDRLAPQCNRLALSANGNPARFEGWEGFVVKDHPEDTGRGPLAGLLAGLDWVASAAPDTDCLLSVPGDTPFVPRDLVERLLAARTAAGAAIAYARSGGRDHPLAALWPLALHHALRHALREEGERRVRAFVVRQGAVAVEWPDAPVDPFFNVNTPADVAEAERLARDG